MSHETITFRIPEDLKKRMLSEVKRRGATMTTFVREALEQELIRSARVRVDLAIDLSKEDP